MIRSLWEVYKAAIGYGLARIRAYSDPCPPHDFTHGWQFCEKCGKYRNEILAEEDAA